MIFNGVIQVAGGGGEGKAAYGNVDGSGGNTLVVNGLGFKPSWIDIYIESMWGPSDTDNTTIIVQASTPTFSWYNYLAGGITYDGDRDLSFNFLEDGFSVTTPGAIFTNEYNYHWVAFEQWR